jgi:hypothetical protein
MAASQNELMKLKQIEKERTMKEKELKRQAKLKKREEKQRKKLEKRRIKLAKKGIILQEPSASPDAKKPSISAAAAAGTSTPPPEAKLPEAEIITAEADVWTPKSARNINEIQKRIDRMDHNKISSIKERYKERYGEDLEVPDAYNVKSSIDVETAERTGELEGLDKDSTGLSTTSSEADTKGEAIKRGLGFGLAGRKDKGLGLGRGKDKRKDKVKIDYPARFLDLRKPLYLKSKFTNEESGGGKKAIFGLLDVIILIISIIIFPIIIIRIIGTFIYIRRDKQDQEIIESMKDESGSAQPTT